MRDANERHDPIKDEEHAHPIASAWRPILRQLVEALAEGDARLARGVPHVAFAHDSTPDQIRAYLAGCGETLAELPDEAWQTSVAQWMGSHWQILVDLWTVESGASDLVLHARVFEEGGGYQIVIDSVHVP